MNDDWVCDEPGCAATNTTSTFTRLTVADREVTLCERHWKERIDRIIKGFKARRPK